MEDPMNRASIIALVIGALLFGCGAGMVASEVLESEADAQGYYAGQKWEYSCFDASGEIAQEKNLEIMNAKGALGWELAVAGDMGNLCFKRPLP
jgi:hypothetical protein